MNNLTKSLCCLSLVALLTVSCGKEQPKARDKTFLTAEKPIKISELLHPALVRNSRGVLLLTAFIHSTFPSATKAHEAIAVFERPPRGA